MEDSVFEKQLWVKRREERELFFALPLLFPLLSLSYFSQLFNCSILLHAKNLFSGKCVSLRSRGGLSKSTSRWAAMFAWFFVSKVNIGTVALDLVDCNISSGWRWIHTTKVEEIAVLLQLTNQLSRNVICDQHANLLSRLCGLIFQQGRKWMWHFPLIVLPGSLFLQAHSVEKSLKKSHFATYSPSAAGTRPPAG